MSSPRSRGSSRKKGREGAGATGRPRARGGHPPPMIAEVISDASSPRSRGSSDPEAHRGRAVAVVPALAGVILWIMPVGEFNDCRPRARGGHPWTFSRTNSALVCRPRARGGHPRGPGRVHAGCVSSPRSRGSSPLPTPTPNGRRRRPRARGGHPRHVVGQRGRQGSSPRSRGSSPVQRQPPERAVVVPALAGVIPAPRAPAPRAGCRPRARGGHPGVAVTMPVTMPSSPRSRGSSPGRRRIHPVDLVVPALAGVIPGW